MNTIEFYTQNLEYKIRFKKEKRFYFLSKFPSALDTPFRKAH